MTSNQPPIVTAIQRYHRGVRSALRHYGIGAADLDDLTQDVFSIFCRRFADVAEPAQRAFLFETARRVASDHRNLKWNRSVFTALDPELVDRVGQTPVASLERSQLRGLTDAALFVLPQAEQSVFLLTHVEHLSRTEIAQKLGLPSGTVASRLRRANHLFADAILRMSRPFEFGVPVLDENRPWGAPGRKPGHFALPVGTEQARGTHLLVDNQWGRARAEGGYDQCLLTRQRAGNTEIGWTWNWPGHHDKGFAIPEIIVGWKPWAGGYPTDPRFPLPLTRIQHLRVDFDVELAALGSCDLVLNLWLIQDLPRGGMADPGLISTEIMVALDHSDAVPRSRFAERIELGGEQYDLWLGSEWQGRLEPWPVITLRRCERSTAGSFDVKALFAALTQHGHIAASDWLGSVEFGNVIFGGQGTAWVRRFDVDLALAD